MSFKISIILSGGKGTRMKPITNYIPKALVRVNGKPLITYVFDMVNSLKKYVTYGHKSEILFDIIKLDVDGFINTTEKDNSYFLYNSFVKYIDEPIIVSPCDMIMNINLSKLYEDYIELGSPAIMVVGVSPIDGVDGDFIEYDDKNYISRVSRDISTDKYCSGLQIINPYKVNNITTESENFYGVWQQLIHLNEIKVSNVTPTRWECYDDYKKID